MKDVHSITIILNKNDSQFVWENENGEMTMTFMNTPHAMHFHFGPGEDTFSELSQKVNFLLNKTSS